MGANDLFSRDVGDLAFRGLFCTIFLGLGGEHIFSDALIQNLMPGWVPAPRLVSIGVGLVLVAGGGAILAGYRLRQAALLLGTFVVAVTLAVHLPAVFHYPPGIPADWAWTWDILQRSNLVKNLCLLGVCIHLYHHRPGRYSLEHWLNAESSAP